MCSIYLYVKSASSLFCLVFLCVFLLYRLLLLLPACSCCSTLAALVPLSRRGHAVGPPLARPLFFGLRGLAYLAVQKVKEIEKVMDRDFYMTAQEAVDFGVVDKILTKRPREGVGSGNV